MNLSEFKAWLEGYSASFDSGVPNAEQWAEVQKRLANVQPLTFAPYAPRPDDSMTKPLEMIRPYYVGDPAPTAVGAGWPHPPPVISTC